jgi:hypothetical protein
VDKIDLFYGSLLYGPYARAFAGALVRAAEQDQLVARRLADGSANLSRLGVAPNRHRWRAIFNAAFDYTGSQRAPGTYTQLNRLSVHSGNAGGFLDIHISHQSDDK